MKMEYLEFLNQKKFILESSGFDIDKSTLNPMLYDFQKDIDRWGLAKGRAAIFADCGLGKTPMQLEWANQVHNRTGGKILVLAPLAVASQTQREGSKFGIDTKICESQSDIINGINITNYEKLDRFTANEFDGIVLDESSILKSFTGKVRTSIIENFQNVPFKLACTATPAPNDYMELGNHAEFLGVMTRAEMLAMFFVHDGGETSKWRLKGHAESVFWQWMASWCVFIDNPINLGYEMDGYDLPRLNINEIIVDGDEPITESLTLTERRQARKESLDLRCQKAAEIANSLDEQCLIWCDMNDESALLTKLIDGAVEIGGKSMQEVFEKIKVMLAEQYRKNRYESHNDEWNVGIDQAEQIVNEVAAEYNNGWIPCSERLPKIYDDTSTSEIVLVQGYDKEIDYDWQAMGWYAEEPKQWYFAECKNTDKPINWIDIIAWQPLPEPYKGEQYEIRKIDRKK